MCKPPFGLPRRRDLADRRCELGLPDRARLFLLGRWWRKGDRSFDSDAVPIDDDIIIRHVYYRGAIAGAVASRQITNDTDDYRLVGGRSRIIFDRPEHGKPVYPSRELCQAELHDLPHGH